MSAPERPPPMDTLRRGILGALLTALVSASALGALVACTGAIEPGLSTPGGPPTVPVHCAASETTVGDTPLRRLSHSEYRFTLGDIFEGLAIDVDLIDDTEVYGFENNAVANEPNPLLVTQYDVAATSLARSLTTAPADDRSRWLGCWPASGDGIEGQRTCGHQIVRLVGRRLFRRPLDGDEAGRYQAFFDGHLDDSGWDVAVRLLLEALLQAPPLLYRVELSEARRGEPLAELTGFEIATRLSYLLWSSAPDEALLSAAEAGLLESPEGRAAEVDRMLDDPRTTRAMVDFHRQWLDLERVEDVNKSSVRFPSYNDDLQQAMRRESELFVQHVFDSDARLATFFNDRTTFVNGPLAELYGLAPSGERFEERTLGEERAGYFTRAAFLASLAHQVEGSPPLRGVFMLRRVMCQSIAPPPPDVDTSEPRPDDADGPTTNRMRFATRTSPPTCQSCHQAINGVGYGFEAFDAVGAHRTIDGELPVDATGWLSGSDVDGPYDGAVELSSRLSSSADVERCFATQQVRYAFGGDPGEELACEVDAIAEAFSASGGDMRLLLRSLALRPELTYRREGGSR